MVNWEQWIENSELWTLRKRMTPRATSNSEETVSDLHFKVSNCFSPSYLTPQTYGIARKWKGDARGHLTISCVISQRQMPGIHWRWVGPFLLRSSDLLTWSRGQPSIDWSSLMFISKAARWDACSSAHRIEHSDRCFRMGCGGRWTCGDPETRALKLPSLNARRVMGNRLQSGWIRSIVGQHEKYEAKLPSRSSITEHSLGGTHSSAHPLIKSRYSMGCLFVTIVLAQTFDSTLVFTLDGQKIGVCMWTCCQKVRFISRVMFPHPWFHRANLPILPVRSLFYWCTVICLQIPL